MIKKMSLIIFALFIVVFPVSCGSMGDTESIDSSVVKETVSNTPAEEDKEPEKITLQTWVYDSFANDNTAPIYALADKFMSENPNVEVEIIPTQYGSSPYRDKFITAAQAGEGPDVLMMDIIWTSQAAAAQLALPIDEFAGDEISNYYPGPLETCTYNGQLYGLPFYTNTVAMFYNKTAFEENNIPLPDSSWTWDDFRNAAKQLTGDGRYGFGMMAGWGGTFEWFPWLWQNGGEILTKDNSKAAFNSPEGIESIEYFLGLITEDGVVPEAAKSWKSWDELAVAFTSEVIAMYEVGDWGIATVDEMQPDFEWDIVSLPMNKNKSSVVGGANWIINANTDYPEEAYKWIDYVTGPEVFDLMDDYYRLAARKGGDQKIVIDDPRMAVFVESLETSRARPSIPNWTTIDYDCLQPAFLKVILEDADIQEVINEAEMCANAALAE